ncbi:transposase [Micromonospora aurantiaca (nom. illeg.)]|uniref:transposase n=1 Tax=Micromonospora aurantiaca (nom. illeg.) TaxID=47850 RepID=UPI003F4D1254
MVVERALETELTEHLGYDKHEPAGREGANSRNGARPKMMLTEIGPARIDVSRVRDGAGMFPPCFRSIEHLNLIQEEPPPP